MVPFSEFKKEIPAYVRHPAEQAVWQLLGGSERAKSKIPTCGAQESLQGNGSLDEAWNQGRRQWAVA